MLISRISSPLQHRGMPLISQALLRFEKSKSKCDTETASRIALYVQDAGVAYFNWSQYANNRAREEDATRRAQDEHRENQRSLETRIFDWTTES